MTVWLLLCSPGKGYASEARKILVLHSYHQGMVWTDDVMEGIYSVFNKNDSETEMYVEYMDTKRHFDEPAGEYISKLRDIYKDKYGPARLDMIISSDDNAFRFLMGYHDELFPGTPVVFCGVNDFEDTMLAGHDHVTGVIEYLDIDANIDLALSLHPDAKAIAIITDTSETGQANRELLEQLAVENRDRAEFIFLDKDNTGLSLEEMLDRLRGLPEKSIVYYSDFLRTGEQFIQQEVSVPEMSRVSERAIYTHYDEILGLGVVGGKLVNGRSHGRKAAEMAVEIMRGVPVSGIPVYKKSINSYMFDYTQLKRFRISESILPPESIIIKRPSSFYRQHKTLVLAVSVVFSVMLISMIAVSLNVFKRRKAERELKLAHDQLEHKVESRTRSLNTANQDLHAEIKERIQAERALEEAKRTVEREKAKVEAIVASIGDGISIQDTTFRVLYQNQLHIDMIGYHVGEFCYRAYQNRDRACENCHLALSFHDRNIHRKQQKRTTEEGTFYYEIVSSPIIDASGNIIAGIEAVRDITDLKIVEQKLREGESRFRAAFENAAVGASMVDLEGKFIKVNSRLCEMLGYTDEELMSKTFSEVTHAEDVHIGLTAMKEMLAGNPGYHSFEKRYIHKAGHVINFVISPSLIRDLDGRPLYFLGLFQDITKRKMMENRLISSLQEKEVLLKEVHHRVKNNMTVIYSLLELQSGHIHDERDREMFRESMNRIKSMAIIHETLYQSTDLARIDFRSYLHHMIKNMFTSYGVTSDRVSVKIDVHDIYLGIDFAIPCGLMINELVSNSLKYAFPDRLNGEIVVALAARPNDTYDLVVSDNGIGLPEDVDIRSARTLGMNLVNALAKQVQGTIALKRGKGTEFLITFARR